MGIRNYDELNDMQKDTLREVGSISVGHAATALSSLLSRTVKMTVPNVRVLDYNDAVESIGNPESIIAGILVRMSGDIEGIMLFIQKLDFINLIINKEFHHSIEDYSVLDELQMSALEEIGNIIISSYTNALSELTDFSFDLSVPSMAINMLGGIITVPMAEYGYETNKIMIIDGKFLIDDKEVSSNLLMMPTVKSLNDILEKLDVNNG